MATTGEVLQNISLLNPGATAQAHLLSAEARTKLLGLNLSSDLIISESVDRTAQLSAEKKTISALNTTMSAETFLSSLTASLSC